MCKEYWNSLVRCLLGGTTERPATWTRQRRSPKNHDRSDNEHPFEDNSDGNNSSNQHDNRPPPPAYSFLF